MDIRKAIKEIDNFHGYSKEGNEAIDMAQVALEKQMPKMLYEDKESDKKFNFLRCPNCKEILHGNVKGGIKTDAQFKIDFCISCGQALIWPKTK